MSSTPNTMKLGMAIGYIGAIASFVCMAIAWDGSVDSAALVGLDMATAMMFFATAGCLSSYSPVKASSITVIGAIAAAFAVISSVFGAMDPVCGVFLVILACICIAVANFSSTKDFVETNRVI